MKPVIPRDEAFRRVQAIALLDEGAIGGGMRPFTPPRPQDWHWVNQGDATLDTSHANLALTCPTDNGGGNNQRMLLAGLQGTGEFTVFGFACDMQVGAGGPPQAACGVCFANGITGKIINVTTLQTGNNQVVSIDKYTNPTTYNSSYLGGTIDNFYAGNLTWIKLKQTLTTRQIFKSRDGLYWTKLFEFGVADFDITNLAGIFFNPLASPGTINLVSVDGGVE